MSHYVALRRLAEFNPPVPQEIRLEPEENARLLPMDAIQHFDEPHEGEVRPIGKLLQGYAYIEPMDVGYAKVTPCFENGKGLVGSDLDGPSFASSEVTVLRPGPQLVQKYLSYVLRSEHFRGPAIASMTGAGGLKRVDEQGMRALKIWLPTLTQQREIADFLDHETAEIDAFIDDQEELITLWKERRRATIWFAVTKGLNQCRTLKKTGVDSLGWVPGDWNIVSISRFVRFGNGSDYKHIELTHGGYPVIGSGGEFRRASKYVFEGESVLFGRKGTVDKPLYVTGKFWTVDTMYYTDIDTGYLLPKFLYYWALRIPFDFYLTNTALPSMTQTDLGSAKIALPPLREQREIVEFIDRSTADMDAAMADAERAIELSKERRAALISSAVTGQIDVTQKRKPVAEVLEGEVGVRV